MYSNAQNRMRMRIFNVLDDVKRESGFAPVVTRPADSPDFKPRVNWSRFHETMPLAEMASDPGARALGKPGLTHTDGVNGPADITGGFWQHVHQEGTSRCASLAADCGPCRALRGVLMLCTYAAMPTCSACPLTLPRDDIACL